MVSAGTRTRPVWSLTMYERTLDRQYFLTPNPLNRRSMGDRTPGLTAGATLSVRVAA